MGRLGFAGIFDAAASAVGKQVFVIGVFVVDCDHAMIRAETKKAHAIVVVANGQTLADGSATRGGVKGCAARQNCVSPRGQHSPLIACWHGDGV